MARIQELTMARGNRALLLIALLAGLISAILVFVTLANSESEGGTSNTPASASAVVVARQDIAAGTEITGQMVEVKQVPDSLLVPGAFASTESGGRRGRTVPDCEGGPDHSGEGGRRA